MIEQTIIFGPENHLVGTVTLPDRSRSGHATTMALLTNAGVIPRIGPHRLNVRLARRFAEMGIATLRFDMSGLGDSRRSSSRRSTGEQCIADTRSAMDLAQSQFGRNAFFMVGFCSGGDVANVVAFEDERLRAVALWDSYVYLTPKSKWLGLLHRLKRQTPASIVRKSVERLGKVVSTPKDDGTPVAPAPVPTIFGRSKMPDRDDFGRRIRTLVDRGVEVFFLYSGGEPDSYNYEGQFRDMFSSYGFVDRVEYDYRERSDHTFIQPHSQQALVERIERWLEERALAAMHRKPAQPDATAHEAKLRVA
jgi:Serine aminopeptidase, S33